MSIQSIATRSALRLAQDRETLPLGRVVTTVTTDDGAPPASPPPPPPSNPVPEYLKKVAAYIPSEAIGLFLGFATFFSVFEQTEQELGLAAVVAIIAVVLAYRATTKAAEELGLTAGASAGKVATITIVAFFAYWAATPGSLFTSDEELGLPPFWVALLLAVVAFALPWLAERWGVEPVHAGSTT